MAVGHPSPECPVLTNLCLPAATVAYHLGENIPIPDQYMVYG